MRKGGFKTILILVCILAIPGFLFYYILPRYAKNRYKSLPIYGERHLADTFQTKRGKKIPDTIYHSVRDFKLINQEGDSVSWSNFKNKIIILNLFYSSAPNALVSENIRGIADGYKKNDLMHFLSLSVDPTDNPSSLKKYFKEINPLQQHWDFLAGDTAKVYPFIRDELNLDVVYHKENGKSSFIYGNQIVLLDTDRRIRGYYEANNQQALSKLDDEIKVLVAEYLRNLKDGR